MSGDLVTRPEFEIWRASQIETNKSIKELVLEIKQTNSLINQDIQQSHQILQAHINQYKIDKTMTKRDLEDINKKVSKVVNIVTDGEDVRRAGRAAKYSIGVIVVGALGAFGAKIAGMVG